MYRIEAHGVAETAPAQPHDLSVDLRCQICQNDMVPPSTADSRRYVALVCESHFVHKSCLARLPRRQCPTCRASSTSPEFPESASRLLWQSGLRPPCGCDYPKHTRDVAAKCPARQVTCLFPDCTEIYFLHEQQDHYNECHPGEPIAENPVCPYKGCVLQDKLTLETFDEHVAGCVYRPVTCVCGESGPLYSIQQHQTQCKKIQCPSQKLLEQRFGVTIPGIRCRHGAMPCPIEALLRALHEADPERIRNVLEEIVQCRQTYAL